jgi:hypothetical protein
MDVFYAHIVDLIESIEDCFAKQRKLPCLTLLYAGIDVIATIECGPGKGTGADFVRWVDQYMLNTRELQCSAMDLYGARCGTLHTFISDSNLSRKGKARKVSMRGAKPTQMTWQLPPNVSDAKTMLGSTFEI